MRKLDISWNNFADWMLKGILAGCGIYGTSSLAKLEDSVSKLNVQMAVIVEQYSWHTRWLERHDDAIRTLQRNK